MSDERYMVCRDGYNILLAEKRDGALIGVEQATAMGSELIEKALMITRARARAERRVIEADLDAGSEHGKRFMDRVMSHELGIRPIIERGDEAWIQPEGLEGTWVKVRILHRNGLHDMWVVQPTDLDSPQDEPIHVVEDDIRPPCAYCGGPGEGCCSIAQGLAELS